MSMSSSTLDELGDQQAAARLQHAMHFGNRGLLIILGNVVQGKRAGDSVKRHIRKGKFLGVGDPEVHRYAMFTRSCSGALDHLRAGVNAGDRAIRSYPFGEDPNETARAAADIENMITRLQLKTVGDHGTQPASSSAQ
jgi:hypothetical protein